MEPFWSNGVVDLKPDSKLRKAWFSDDAMGHLSLAGPTKAIDAFGPPYPPLKFHVARLA